MGCRKNKLGDRLNFTISKHKKVRSLVTKEKLRLETGRKWVANCRPVIKKMTKGGGQQST